MARRPVFIPDRAEGVVREVGVEFRWIPGLARSQAQKCIRSLHDAARKELGVQDILEISRKSESALGVALSAFNLSMDIRGTRRPVECVYQASKVFAKGGPYQDLLDMRPGAARKDDRLRNSGNLRGFRFENEVWGLAPQTAFYDYLYVRALYEAREMNSSLRSADAFTDIAFNPARSVSCQARAAALFVLLDVDGLVEDAILSRDAFLKHHVQRIGGCRDRGLYG